jgi:AmmeMemoRadiSam system protein A
MSELLTSAQQEYLLRLARDTITAHLRGVKEPPAATDDPVLKGKRGVFVTLHIDGELRGCIGYPLPYKPLVETISGIALAAATQDLRFESIRESELERLRIEISALTLPRPIQDPAEVEVGRHGIIISKGGRQGLLLPQVPLEYNWDRETFLRHGCLKAGLPENEWKKGAAIQVFEAQVFSEPE